MNLKIFTDNIEEQARQQIDDLLSVPVFSEFKVRIMPDVHAGAGCVIGFTGNLGDKVIPNIVGVDIGCGMLTVELENIDLTEQDLADIDTAIHTYIPAGRNYHTIAVEHFDYSNMLCFDMLKHREVFDVSIGTLGGGNHFIEIDKDENGKCYLVIHTGSRNLGKQVAEYYQREAENIFAFDKFTYKEAVNNKIAELKAIGNERLISSEIAKIKQRCTNISNVPKELSWLENTAREHYLNDMRICQKYAKLNRKTIADIILKNTALKEVSRFETVHNYIGDDNIVRKGAISAYKNEQVLIPLNMRDGCILGIGKGNEDWNYSAPHGAGRVLSRAQAKATINIDDYKNSMSGIFTTSVNADTIDESPMAYKPSEEIISLVKDTVDIVKIIKPIYNFKASE